MRILDSKSHRSGGRNPTNLQPASSWNVLDLVVHALKDPTGQKRCKEVVAEDKFGKTPNRYWKFYLLKDRRKKVKSEWCSGSGVGLQPGRVSILNDLRPVAILQLHLPHRVVENKKELCVLP